MQTRIRGFGGDDGVAGDSRNTFARDKGTAESRMDQLASGGVQSGAYFAGGVGQQLPDCPMGVLCFAAAGAPYRLGVLARCAASARADVGRRTSFAQRHVVVDTLAAMDLRQRRT